MHMMSTSTQVYSALIGHKAQQLRQAHEIGRQVSETHDGVNVLEGWTRQ